MVRSRFLTACAAAVLVMVSTAGPLANRALADTVDSTTTLLSNHNPSVHGQGVIFTASVTGAAGTPTGTVQFKIDGTNSGSAVALDAGGMANSASVTSMTTAGHSITAVYSGDATYNPSTSDPLSQTVNKADTTVTITRPTNSSSYNGGTNSNPGLPGQTLAFTASVGVVSPGSGNRSGTVQFQDNGVNIGSAVTVSSNAATLTTNNTTLNLTAGSHLITATYSGSADFNTSTSGAYSESIVDGTFVRLSQVGYEQDQAPFRAYLMANVDETGATFDVIDSHGTHVVSGAAIGALTGTWTNSTTSSFKVYALDFTVPGGDTYTISVTGPRSTVSPEFPVDTAANLYEKLLGNSLFYYSSVRDGPDYVPGPLSPGPAHLNDETSTVYYNPTIDGDDNISTTVGVTTTIATAVGVGDTVIPVVSATGFNAGNTITISGDTKLETRTIAASGVDTIANTLTVTAGLANAHTVGVDVSTGTGPDHGLRSYGLTADTSGGHWDAGDNMNYLETESYTTALMQIAVRDFPDQAGPNAPTVPSGPGSMTPDFTAETEFGMDFVSRMWDDSRGILFLQNGNTQDWANFPDLRGDYDIWRLPQEDDTYPDDPGDDYRYIRNEPTFLADKPGSTADPTTVLLSPNLAGRVAADFALYYQLHRTTDPAKANVALLSAEHVYARANTAWTGSLVTIIPFDGYGESTFHDDLALGATELYFALQQGAGHLPDGLPVTDPMTYLSTAATQEALWVSGSKSDLNLYDTGSLAAFELYRAIDLAGNPGGLATTKDALVGAMNSVLNTANNVTDAFGFGRSWRSGDTTSNGDGLSVDAMMADQLLKSSPVATTLTADSLSGDTVLTVATNAGFASGNSVLIDTGGNLEKRRVTATTSTTLTVTPALSLAHSSGTGVSINYDDSARRWLANVLGANSWGVSLIIGDGSSWTNCPQQQPANLLGSLTGGSPVLWGAAVEGPTSGVDVGGYDTMNACPVGGGYPSAYLNGRSSGSSNAIFNDNVESYSSSEPAIDLTSSSFLMFAWRQAGAPASWTDTTLSTAGSPVLHDDTTDVLATVTSTGPSAPTGNVKFYVNSTSGTYLGHAALSPAGGSTATATFHLDASDLEAGTNKIVGYFPGDSAVDGPSTSYKATIEVVIGTTTAVQADVNPSQYGGSPTFTATVTPGDDSAGDPTGTVQFRVDGSDWGTPVTLAGGMATSDPVIGLSVGDHTIIAIYDGEDVFAGSTSDDYSQTVARADTDTVVVSDVNPSAHGQAVTFTATVTSAGGTPTGSVQFKVNGSDWGTAKALDGFGMADADPIDSLLTGSSTITATYSGDDNFQTSTSLDFIQGVDTAATTTELASDHNPSVFGQAVTFTATVTADAPGSGTPTGTVQFKADGSNLGAPVALDGSGVAMSAPITALAAADHGITAVYSGGGDFSTSTSETLDQVVHKATTTVALKANHNPSVFGQKVKLTATVSVSAPGAGSPTGSVQFKVGLVNLGAPVGLVGGKARLTVSSLVVGNDAIVAVYLGDGSFKQGTSPALLQVVHKAATELAVTAKPNPAHFGHNVKLIAKVHVEAPGAGAPAGTVTFYIDGAKAAPAVSVSGHKAVLHVSYTLTLGHHTVTATFHGNGSFKTSHSPAYGLFIS
jgi:Glycosyl hydrolase family 9/Bacterial Ig-like domain (group 3)